MVGNLSMRERVTRTARRAIEAARLVSAVSAAICMILILLIVSSNSISRTLVGQQILASPAQYAGYLLIAFVFLGISYSFGSGGFVRVDVPYRKYPTALKYWLGIAFRVITLPYALLLAVSAWRQMEQHRTAGTGTPGLGELPMFVPWLGMALGASLCCAYLLCDIAYQLLRRGAVPSAPDN